MKKGNRLIPALFTLVIGSLLIISIPVDFNKYRLVLKLGHFSAPHESYAFADVDGDGLDDLIDCGGVNNSGERREACFARTLKSGYLPFTIDQFNVNQLIYGEKQILSSNYDNDAFDELLIPDVVGEELYLTVFEGPEYTNPIARFYLDSIRLDIDKPVLVLQSAGQQDVNQDGLDEIFLFVGNGFPVYPRRIYRIDLANEEVLSSPASSVGFLAEIDKESKFLTGYNLNPGNHKDSVNLPFPDTWAYAYVMDTNLNMAFEPIPLVPYPGGVNNCILNGHLFTIIRKGENEVGVLLQKRSLSTGELLKEVHLDYFTDNMFKSKGALVVVGDGVLLRVDDELRVIERREHQYYTSTIINLMDVDFDGSPEMVCQQWNSKQFAIFSSEFSDPIFFSSEAKGKFNILRRRTGIGKGEFVIRRDNNLEFYEYQSNPYFWLRWPYYVLIFLSTGLASTVLFRRFRQNIEKKYEQERQLSRLQLLSIKNQVDPHFTLNALNSIDWMYRNNETTKASSFMGKLSRMMNQTVLNSDKISSTLWEELDFCRNYCQLEKLRDEQFYFEIEVDENLDAFEIEVPKQLLFTYVENAIKHGLRPKEGEKHLWLEAAKTAEGIEITVEDDGLGFKENAETSGTGKGLKIVEEMVELWERLKGGRINIQMEGQSAVLVMITLMSPTPNHAGSEAHKRIT